MLDRAIDAARAIAPSDHTAAGYRLAAALSEPLVAPRAAVQVWASDVRVDLADEDSERLAKLERIQKNLRLWEQERVHEKEVRRYLGEDALASPGTALVWWLARHEDDIRGAVDRIPDLTRISAVARDLHLEDVVDPGREDANSATAVASDDYGYGPAKPSAPADAAREMLYGLFPQNDAGRARAARHLALVFERWGQRDLAHSLRGSDGTPHDSDEALQAPSQPHDHIEEPEPLSAHTSITRLGDGPGGRRGRRPGVSTRRIILDTDVASLSIKKALPPALLRELLGAQIGITFVTLAELHRWALLRNGGAQKRTGLNTWLSTRPTLPYTDAVARKWGEITAYATRRGRPRPQNDSWIAACCLVYDLPLATLNVKDFADFAEHEGLRIVGQ